MRHGKRMTGAGDPRQSSLPIYPAAMEPAASRNNLARLDRELSNLKLLSRLLGHELSCQNGKRISLSREEVLEMQTSIDLFIEEAMRFRGTGTGMAGGFSGGVGGVNTESVTTRVN